MLDVLSEMDEIKVCVAYELDGQTIDYFPGNINQLKRVKPVYRSFPGWKKDVTGARSLDDLPIEAIQYAHELEKLIGAPIEFISVGPDRAQTIILEKGTTLADRVSATV